MPESDCGAIGSWDGLKMSCDAIEKRSKLGPMAKEKQPKQNVTLRLSPEMIEKLDAIAQGLDVPTTRGAVLRHALELGLRQMEGNLRKPARNAR